MKNLILVVAALTFITSLAQAQTQDRSFTDVASVRLKAKLSIPLFKFGWTVIEHPDPKVFRASEFIDTTEVVCGIGIPDGVARYDAVTDSSYFISENVTSTERFVHLKTQDSNGRSLLVLCGKGYNRERAEFWSRPTVNEVTQLLGNYFEILINYAR